MESSPVSMVSSSLIIDDAQLLHPVGILTSDVFFDLIQRDSFSAPGFLSGLSNDFGKLRPNSRREPIPPIVCVAPTGSAD
jgi:hypothetical protein